MLTWSLGWTGVLLPNGVQRKHVVMLAGENLVAHLDDQIMTLLVEAFSCKVRVRSGFLQNRVGRDHLPGNQILANAEVFERTLSLRTPELVGWNIHLPETV